MCDFKEMTSSTFKVAKGETMCRHEIEEGAYEFCERKDDSNNYFKIEEPHETLEWKNILSRKFKVGVVKIINKFCV